MSAENNACHAHRLTNEYFRVRFLQRNYRKLRLYREYHKVGRRWNSPIWLNRIYIALKRILNCLEVVLQRQLPMKHDFESPSHQTSCGWDSVCVNSPQTPPLFWMRGDHVEKSRKCPLLLEMKCVCRDNVCGQKIDNFPVVNQYFCRLSTLYGGITWGATLFITLWIFGSPFTAPQYSGVQLAYGLVVIAVFMVGFVAAAYVKSDSFLVRVIVCAILILGVGLYAHSNTGGGALTGESFGFLLEKIVTVTSSFS